MKRRSFLALLGMAPAGAAVAKHLLPTDAPKHLLPPAEPVYYDAPRAGSFTCSAAPPNYYGGTLSYAPPELRTRKPR